MMSLYKRYNGPRHWSISPVPTMWITSSTDWSGPRKFGDGMATNQQVLRIEFCWLSWQWTCEWRWFY